MILRNLTSFRPAHAVVVSLVMTAASPAAAIIKGEENNGPMKSRTVMVLSEGGGVCSGIVVAQDVILTAGHCVAGGRNVMVHYRDLSGDPRMFPTAEVAKHGGFNADAIKDRKPSIDLALIRMEEPLPKGFLPAALSAASLPRAGTPVSAYGWGSSKEGDATTTGTFRMADLVTVEPYGPGKLLLWAADPIGMAKRPGAGVCQGDSGGPITKSDGAVIAVSTWSNGSGNSKCGLYTQGMLLAPQRGFIDGTLKRWNRTADWR